MSETQSIHRNKATPPNAAILLALHQAAPREFEIGDLCVLGRSGDCPVRVDDPFVSQRHARLERKDQGYVLRDLRSRNGTYLNGARVVEANLNHLDHITIGRTQFLFSTERDTKKPRLLKSSRSPKWRSALDQLPRLAQSDLPILIQGPSGSGKEGVAAEIHQASSRAMAELQTVNCSALSESLIESELFGHIRGSFTGAETERQGAFVAAHGGTLFLDEVGDLPLSLQPKLLRAIQQQEVRAVGSDRARKVDVRVIAATHKDLRKLVAQGLFRMDLFFRLNVLRIDVPPLADRMEDFEDLLYHFAKIHRVRFSVQAIDFLKDHSWPGNIRELNNLVARASTLDCGPDGVDSLSVAQLLRDGCLSPTNLLTSWRDETTQFKPPELSTFLSPISPHLPSAPSAPATPAAGDVLKSMEKKMITDALLAFGGNQRRASRSIGMPKSTFNDRLFQYGIDPEKFKDHVRV